MKGIILAGGSGSRLYPITKGISKQIMPIYNKPMIYYTLTTLIQAGIHEILIINHPHDQPQFKRLLGDGKQLGCHFEYAAPDIIRGTADTLVIAEEFANGDAITTILGDTLLHGTSLSNTLKRAENRTNEQVVSDTIDIADGAVSSGATGGTTGGVTGYVADGVTVFALKVADPRQYGVVEFNTNGLATSIEEKPENPRSPYAVVGLSVCENAAINIAKAVTPSVRGEHEITDVYESYMHANKLHIEVLGEDVTWFDTGTLDSLTRASEFVRENIAAGHEVGCPEEAAWRQGLIDDKQLRQLGKSLSTSEYGQYLLGLPS